MQKRLETDHPKFSRQWLFSKPSAKHSAGIFPVGGDNEAGAKRQPDVLDVLLFSLIVLYTLLNSTKYMYVRLLAADANRENNMKYCIASYTVVGMFIS